VISLSLGALICGFFWEMWNFLVLPQWIYHTPGAQFLHVFAMRCRATGGYIPFALELFGLKNLLWHARQSWNFDPGSSTMILIHRCGSRGFDRPSGLRWKIKKIWVEQKIRPSEASEWR